MYRSEVISVLYEQNFISFYINTLGPFSRALSHLLNIQKCITYIAYILKVCWNLFLFNSILFLCHISIHKAHPNQMLSSKYTLFMSVTCLMDVTLQVFNQ